MRNDGQLRLLQSASVGDTGAVSGRKYVKPEWDPRCTCDIISGGKIYQTNKLFVQEYCSFVHHLKSYQYKKCKSGLK